MFSATPSSKPVGMDMLLVAHAAWVYDVNQVLLFYFTKVCLQLGVCEGMASTNSIKNRSGINSQQLLHVLPDVLRQVLSRGRYTGLGHL